MILSICLEDDVLMQLKRVNGPGGLEKTVFTARLGLNSDKTGSLDIDDIDYLRKKLPGINLSYLARQEGMAEGNHKTAGVKVLGINYLWPRFYALNITAGSMWTPQAENEGQRVAVISSELAIRLYGTMEVINTQIKVLGKDYLIAGIYTPSAGILKHLTDDGIPEVYIPGAAFFETVQNPFIRELQIDSAPAGSLDSAKMIPALLHLRGKDMTAYTAIDYHMARVLMEQVPQIQVFIMGILPILVILKFWLSRIRNIAWALRRDSREDDFRIIMKKRRREIRNFLGLTAGLLAVIVFIWSRIHFSPYIPPRLIPDDLIDISHYAEVVKQDISTGQIMAEYCRPETEVQLGVCKIINRFLYYIAWPLGLGRALYAWSQYKRKAGECNE